MNQASFPLAAGQSFSFHVQFRKDFDAFCRDGHYGLYIDDTLIDGTTHHCQTFENDHLARGIIIGNGMRFECVGLEVWGIDH